MDTHTTGHDIGTAPAAPPASVRTTASAEEEEEAGTSARTVKLHPLAIVGIADHHTRVVTGGSKLPAAAPVVGLLFGHSSSSSAEGGGSGDGRAVSVVDAEEVECPGDGDGDGDAQRAAVWKKIELYRKVFPQRRVVGWYRVRREEESAGDAVAEGEGEGAVLLPSDEDLRVSQAEMARYCRGEDGEEEGLPLFALMQGGARGGRRGSSAAAAHASDAAGEMAGDEALPLAVYETLPGAPAAGGGAVFVHADFELETHEPERIAVERVFRAPAAAPPRDGAEAGAGAGGPEGGGEADVGRQAAKKSKKGDAAAAADPPPPPPSARGPAALDGQLDALRAAVRALNVRTTVLLEFLQRAERGEVAADDALLRRVDGLVQQLPLVLAALEEGGPAALGGGGGGDARQRPRRDLDLEHDGTMILTYLAAVAKTANSVHAYSEKFRSMCESGRSDPRRPLY